MYPRDEMKALEQERHEARVALLQRVLITLLSVPLMTALALAVSIGIERKNKSWMADQELRASITITKSQQFNNGEKQ